MDRMLSTASGQPNQTTTERDIWAFLQYPEYRATEVIWAVCPPIILLLGVFGNIATVFVMRRIKDHNSSQHAILMSLAVSDFILLCLATTRGWLWYVFQVDIQSLHDVSCKALMWITYASGTTSAWLVTCVTVQRTLAVLWPHRMRAMCTVRRTWLVIAALVLTACAVDAHVLVGMQLVRENFCGPMAGLYKQFFELVFTWVDSCLISLFPSLCLFVCDIILSVTLFRALSSSSSLSGASAGGGRDSRRTTSYRTTVTVLAISCAFLLLTTPVCVYSIWIGLAYKAGIGEAGAMAMAYLLAAVTHQLWYFNSAVNFFLYCLTGTKFRREFLSWIRCAAQSPSAPSVHTPGVETAKGERKNIR